MIIFIEPSAFSLNLPLVISVPGASTGDPTHDKVMQRGLMGKASQASGVPPGFS